MNIFFDNDLNAPEIAIEACPEEFRMLGHQLLNEKRDSCFIVFSQGRESKYYPVSLNQIIFDTVENTDGVISLHLDNELLKLSFSSNGTGFAKLGKSLLNFFSEPVIKNQHFHLDYIEGIFSNLLAPTNIALIFCAKTE